MIKGGLGGDKTQSGLKFENRTDLKTAFIMLKDYPLQNNYTIFGRVREGIEVVDQIGKVQTDANDRPIENVLIKKVIVTEN